MEKRNLTIEPSSEPRSASLQTPTLAVPKYGGRARKDSGRRTGQSTGQYLARGDDHEALGLLAAVRDDAALGEVLGLAPHHQLRKAADSKLAIHPLFTC